MVKDEVKGVRVKNTSLRCRPARTTTSVFPRVSGFRRVTDVLPPFPKEKRLQSSLDLSTSTASRTRREFRTFILVRGRSEPHRGVVFSHRVDDTHRDVFGRTGTDYKEITGRKVRTPGQYRCRTWTNLLGRGVVSP